MARKALIVSGAAGSLEAATSVLARFGFGEPSPAIDVGGALAELQHQTYGIRRTTCSSFPCRTSIRCSSRLSSGRCAVAASP
jgi:hypothetical protein